MAVPEIIPSEDGWDLYTLSDAFQKREPVQHIAESRANALFAVPSVNMVVGGSGDLKSMLLADLLVSVASGQPWLTPFPNGVADEFKTLQGPVAWLNQDNPTWAVHERFQALARARGLTEKAPLYYWSHPNPALLATNGAHMGKLIERLQFLEVHLLVVDCLQTVKDGSTDENSELMVAVVRAFRPLSELCQCAVILVHHVNKLGGYRGSSSIENMLDLMLIIERAKGSPDIAITAGKVRAADVKPFGASFKYEHKLGSRELHSAKFYGLKIDDGDAQAELVEAILDHLKVHPSSNQTEIVTAMKEADFCCPGRNEIRDLLGQLISKGILSKSSGPKNSTIYRLNERFQCSTL
ncbi:AAA family ATPase [bacterium]|nr:AAA family ATPase [bacterium]